MRYFGRERMCEIIRNHIEWAQELAEAIDSHPQFEIAAPHPFSLVCFRFKGSDEQNRDLMDRVNAGGVAFLSHTVLHDRFTIRLAIGNVRTTRDDVQRVWECLQAEAGDL
jgi:aromatic-L-amino-acid decarboxylase